MRWDKLGGGQKQLLTKVRALITMMNSRTINIEACLTCFGVKVVMLRTVVQCTRQMLSHLHVKH